MSLKYSHTQASWLLPFEHQYVMYWVQLFSPLNGRAVVTDCVALFRVSSPTPGLERAAHMPFPSPPLALERWSGSLWQRLSRFCPLRAAEWQLDQPSWSGRLRITAKGQVAYIKLEDRTSGKGDGGLLGAEAPCLPLCEGRGSPGLMRPLGGHGDLSWKSKTRVHR